MYMQLIRLQHLLSHTLIIVESIIQVHNLKLIMHSVVARCSDACMHIKEEVREDISM
jgi:hypothetical protein